MNTKDNAIFDARLGMVPVRLIGALPFTCIVLALAACGSSSNKRSVPTTSVAEDNVMYHDGPVTVALRHGVLQLKVCSDRIVRVSYGPDTAVPTRPSLAVIDSCASTHFTVKEDAEQVSVTTPALQVRVGRANETVTFLDQTGKVLLAEAAGGRDVTDATVIGEATHSIKQRFILEPDDALYGLGQYEDGIMNFRGHDVLLAQSNTVAVVPFLLSTGNWGLLWDNNAKTWFHDGSDGMSFASEVGDGIDYYFVSGTSSDEVIAGYRQLTGPAPMFPKWVFGYWQSKERYASAKELLSIADEYRRRKIPIDVLVQDWKWWPEGKWSGMSCDDTRFPDPAGCISIPNRIIWPNCNTEESAGKAVFCALPILEIEGMNKEVGEAAATRRAVRRPRKPSARGNLGFVQEC